MSWGRRGRRPSTGSSNYIRSGGSIHVTYTGYLATTPTAVSGRPSSSIVGEHMILNRDIFTHLSGSQEDQAGRAPGQRNLRIVACWNRRPRGAQAHDLGIIKEPVKYTKRKKHESLCPVRPHSTPDHPGKQKSAVGKYKRAQTITVRGLWRRTQKPRIVISHRVRKPQHPAGGGAKWRVD